MVLFSGEIVQTFGFLTSSSSGLSFAVCLCKLFGCVCASECQIVYVRILQADKTGLLCLTVTVQTVIPTLQV